MVTPEVLLLDGEVVAAAAQDLPELELANIFCRIGIGAGESAINS